MSMPNFPWNSQNEAVRGNLFLIEFDTTNLILTDIPKSTLQLQVRSTNIPGFELNVKEDSFLNRKTAMPAGLKQVMDWDVTFREKYGANSVANILEQWRMIAMNYDFEQGTIDSVKTDCIVSQLYLDGTPTGQQWRLINFFPYRVDQIPIEYKEDGDLIDFKVTFKYDYRTIVSME